MSTTWAAARAYGVRLRRLHFARSFIHNAAKPLGQRALERKSRHESQNKQKRPRLPAGSPSNATDTARLSTRATPSMWCSPQPCKPRPPEEQGTAHVSQPGAHSRSPSRGTPGEAPTLSAPLPQQRVDPALGDVRGGCNVGFCPPPLQPPRLVGHQILLIVSQMCLALFQGLCNPCPQAMRDTPSLTRGVRRDPRGEIRTAGLARQVLSRTVRREERLFQAVERAGPRCEGTEEPGVWRRWGGSCRETGCCSSRNCGLSNLAAWDHIPALPRSSCVLGWRNSLEVRQGPREENADNHSICLMRLL